jgi:RNA polymerase sigma factor (sigma-70 family)
MDERDWLAARFEEHRARLRTVAARVLGSTNQADDAVQEAWLRFSRSDTSGVENLGSWLTTVVSRICLNMLQARASRPESAFGLRPPESAATGAGSDPEDEALLADSVGLALLVVLDSLSPPERVALVLHDMFGVSFAEIAPILGRNTAAARQLASRARRRLRAGTVDDVRAHQAELVEAFLAASRRGDFAALVALLDPDVVLRADATAVGLGIAPELRGAAAVLPFARRAGGAEAALVDGRPGAVWMPDGRPRVVFHFAIEGQRITAVELVADQQRLDDLDLTLAGPLPAH